MTTGERIAFYRERANMKMVDLAKKIGITRQLLWKYETNRVDDIPIKNIAKIGEVLGVFPTVIAGWETEEEAEYSHRIVKLINAINSPAFSMDTRKLVYLACSVDDETRAKLLDIARIVCPEYMEDIDSGLKELPDGGVK